VQQDHEVQGALEDVAERRVDHTDHDGQHGVDRGNHAPARTSTDSGENAEGRPGHAASGYEQEQQP
jgi:hypothetical protein